MNTRLVSLKISISTKSVLKVVSNWPYTIIFILGWLASEGVMLWSLNLELVKFILFDSRLSLGEKADFFIASYIDIFSTLGILQAGSILLFSALFGINFSLLVFTLINRNKKSIPKKSGAVSMVLAVIGGGCLACGTSLLYPVLVTLGISTTFFAQKIGLIITWVSVGFLLYSIYKLGAVVSFILKSR